MELRDKKIGFALTGSFCTFTRILDVLKTLKEEGAILYPIFSDSVMNMDNRFWSAKEFRKEVLRITDTKEELGIDTIQKAEPIGPKGYLDCMIIAPCTGNTLGKLSGGITDTPVLMAAKAHLRNELPLVLAVSTNDALGMNLKNIGLLMNTKNIYFVPFGQDDYGKKPKSLVAHMEQIPESIILAMQGKQIQPVIRDY